MTNTLAPTVSDRAARSLRQPSRRLAVQGRMMVPVVVVDAAGVSAPVASKDVLRDAAAGAAVVVVVPAWFGMADRHRLVTDIDRDRIRPVGLVSSTLAAACGHAQTTTREESSPTVLCLDVRHGWSAGLVRFTSDGAAEVASWALAPDGSTDRVIADADAVHRVLAAAKACAGGDTVRSVLVIDDVGHRAQLVGDIVRQGGYPWTRCDVVVADGRLVLRGAASLARQPGRARHAVGALTYPLSVRAGDDAEHRTMHVVAAQHAPIPSTTRLTFALGPDDGAPLHFDVFEDPRGIAADETVEQPADNRVVLRAHLVRERGFDQNMVVTFDLGADGLLSIGPTKAWRLEWQPGSLQTGVVS